MTKPQTKRKKPKGERRSTSITFRTTLELKALAERLARAEGRSLANLLEQLIWNECRGGLDRAAPASRAQQLTA